MRALAVVCAMALTAGVARAVVCAMALTAGVARAEIGAADPVAAATLLLPYFEVDLGDVNGGDTVLTIVNTSNRARPVHVTLWTDWAVPTLAFDVVLEGHGLQEIFLREVFLGRIPEAPPHLLADAAMLQGIAFTNCSEPLLDAADVVHIVAAHTGAGSERYGDRCAGTDHGDGIARGFVTVDLLFNCAGAMLPNETGYFGASGSASEANILSGHYALLNRGAGYAVGEMLVPIEASPLVSGSTFYTEIAASGGDDNRERLPHVWGGAFIGGETRATDVIVWRDPLTEISPVPCGSTPDEFPFPPPDVSLSDSEGNTIALGGFEPFPAATNRTRIGDDELPTLFDSGYAHIELIEVEEGAAATSGILVPFGPQGYVTFVHHHGLGPASAHRASNLRMFE